MRKPSRRPTPAHVLWVLSLCTLCAFVVNTFANDGKYSLKTAATPAPKELKEPVRAALGPTSLQWLDDKGAAIGELWFRKELPAKATPAQVQNGLTYREVEEGTLVGAVRLDRMITDYRKQKVPPGVYTLRLGLQPMDGDHMGTALHTEFLLFVPATVDAKPEPLETKQLREESAKTVKGSHPAVLMLFPNDKPEAAPKLVPKEGGHWVLMLKNDVTVGGQRTFLGIGLTLVGHTTAE